MAAARLDACGHTPVSYSEVAREQAKRYLSVDDDGQQAAAVVPGGSTSASGSVFFGPSPSSMMREIAGAQRSGALSSYRPPSPAHALAQRATSPNNEDLAA